MFSFIVSPARAGRNARTPILCLTFDHKSFHNQRIKIIPLLEKMQNSESDKGVVITFCDGYVHISHPDNFVILSEDIEGLWKNLTVACRTYNCSRVLNEGKIDLSKLRAFDSFSAGSQAGEIEGLRMACLFKNYQPDEKFEFFKTVAANRGAKVEFFLDKAEALKWLGASEND